MGTPMREQGVIFVHIPKAAGTSLKQALVEANSEGAFCFDYGRPMAKGSLRRKIDCLYHSVYGSRPLGRIIFGHFLVGKYARPGLSSFRKDPRFKYAVFLREPLQRAISHFHFWKRTLVPGHRVWETFMRENWDIERFLLGDEHRNFQSQFLWRFNLSQFDFVGLAERYEESLRMLGAAIPLLADLNARKENVNPQRSPIDGYVVAPSLAAAFKQRNNLDYVLYDQALELFAKQQARFGGEHKHQL